MLGELLNLLLAPFSLLLRRVSGRRRAAPDEMKRFYKSVEWKRLRYAHLAKLPACLACGRSAKDGARMNVDHIKPLHRHWHLRLAPGNLQTLCALCNQQGSGLGSKGTGASKVSNIRGRTSRRRSCGVFSASERATGSMVFSRLTTSLRNTPGFLNEIQKRAGPMLLVNDVWFGEEALQGPPSYSSRITTPNG